MLDITEFILQSFKNRICWSVGQNDRILVKGAANKDELIDVIKKTEIHIPTPEELAVEQEKKIQRYNKLKEAIKLKAKKKKEAEDKRIEAAAAAEVINKK